MTNRPLRARALLIDVTRWIPAHSPNLNLIERLWKHLKKKSLENKHFKDFATLRATIDSYLDKLGATCQKELESLLTLKFQSFGNHKMC